MLSNSTRRTRRLSAPSFLICGIFAIAAGLAQSQKATAVRPQFEVASIKLDTACRVGQSAPIPSPGRLQVSCITLEDLIQLAYVTFANGVTINRQVLEIAGGPGWIHSARYDLTAKAEGNPGFGQMSGPMLQALLEDRFQLKIHRQTREAEVYALRVAKNGLKLQPAKDGGCVALDLNHWPPETAPGQPRPTICGNIAIRTDAEGMMLEGRGMKMAEFSQGLNFDALLDRPVIDKTGFAGLFDLQLRCARRLGGGGGGKKGGGAANPAAPLETSGPSLPNALQEQLGLKLVPEKGPVEFLAIEHVERPAAN